MQIKAPRGCHDILPQKIGIWQYLEENFRKVCSLFSYKEIRTPIIEETSLFTRSIGEETDIIDKEIYSFKDRGDREIALRPEGTASIARSYIENKIYQNTSLFKVYYLGPMFRYDRPQAGRYRQFHHLGCEAIGSGDSSLDLEVIMLSLHFFNKIGIENLKLNINNIGCKKCRPEYILKLEEYLKENSSSLCSNCQRRLEKNILRVLDCKEESCKKIIIKSPNILEFLCEDCKTHFEKLKTFLNIFNIKYNIVPNLVRGLDYYTKTCFEITSSSLGAQNAICGGGRYDDLIEELGGPSSPAVGMAIGAERITLLLENKNIILEEKNKVFIAPLGESAKQEALKILFELREKNISCDLDYKFSSLKSQLKYANKNRARFVIIIGDNEIEKNVLILRDLKKSEQEEIKRENLLDTLKSMEEK